MVYFDRMDMMTGWLHCTVKETENSVGYLETENEGG